MTFSLKTSDIRLNKYELALTWKWTKFSRLKKRQFPCNLPSFTFSCSKTILCLRYWFARFFSLPSACVATPSEPDQYIEWVLAKSPYRRATDKGWPLFFPRSHPVSRFLWVMAINSSSRHDTPSVYLSGESSHEKHPLFIAKQLEQNFDESFRFNEKKNPSKEKVTSFNDMNIVAIS